MREVYDGGLQEEDAGAGVWPAQIAALREPGQKVSASSNAGMLEVLAQPVEIKQFSGVQGGETHAAGTHGHFLLAHDVVRLSGTVLHSMAVIIRRVSWNALQMQPCN